MPKKMIIRSLKLDEISGVDRGAQEGALAVLIKRAPDESAEPIIQAAAAMRKEYSSEGANTFSDIMERREAIERHWECREALWPMFDALSDSLYSIANDVNLETAGKVGKIGASVEEFAAAVRAKFPDGELADVEKALPEELRSVFAEALSKQEKTMPNPTKKASDTNELTLEQALAKIAEHESAIATLTAERDEAVAKAAEAETKAAESAAEVEKLAKNAPADETVEVGGQIFKRSENESVFKAMKAVQDERETERLEKRAEADFAFLPGTTAEKLPLLKSVMTVKDAEGRKAVLDWLAKANSALGEALGEKGSDGANASTGDASEAYEAGLSKYMEDNPNLTRQSAVFKFNKTETGRRLRKDMATH